MKNLGPVKVLVYAVDEVLDIVSAVPDKVPGIDYFGTYIRRTYPDLILTATISDMKSEQVYVILSSRSSGE